MRDGFLWATIVIVGAAAVSVPVDTAAAQTVGSAAASRPASPLQTPWGEPDLQGIWTDEFDTPLQRPAKYANQEFFTEDQRKELDRQRSELLSRRATEREVAGAYNLAVFTSSKHTGARTSLIADPPNGRIPPFTPAAQKAAAADREFRLALLQATDTCKNKLPQCAGGKYDPLPRRGGRKTRRATSPAISGASTAMTARRMARCRTAA